MRKGIQRLNNISQIPPPLQQAYNFTLSTLRTAYYDSKKSHASCAGCGTPKASYAHVSMDCPALGDPGSLFELKSCKRQPIDRTNSSESNPHLSNIISTLNRIHSRFQRYERLSNDSQDSTSSSSWPIPLWISTKKYIDHLIFMVFENILTKK